jgi:hypothetical protein
MLADWIAGALSRGLRGSPLAYARELGRFAKTADHDRTRGLRAVAEAAPVPLAADAERGLLECLFPTSEDLCVDERWVLWSCLERTRLAGPEAFASAVRTIAGHRALDETDLIELARRGSLDGGDLVQIAQGMTGTLPQCVRQLPVGAGGVAERPPRTTDLRLATALMENDSLRADLLCLWSATAGAGVGDNAMVAGACRFLSGKPLSLPESKAAANLLIDCPTLRVRKESGVSAAFAQWILGAAAEPLLSAVWAKSGEWIESPPTKAAFHERDAAVLALLADPPPAQSAGCLWLIKSLKACWPLNGTVPWKNLRCLIRGLNLLQPAPAEELLELCLEGMLESTPGRRRLLRERVHVLLEVEPAAAAFAPLAGELKSVARRLTRIQRR